MPRANALLSSSRFQMELVCVGTRWELLGESERSPEERGCVTLSLGALPVPPRVLDRPARSKARVM